MTLTQQQAIDMIQQYQEIGLDLKCIIDGKANRLDNAHINNLTDMIQQGIYNKYYGGLGNLLLEHSSEEKYNIIVTTYAA